MEISYEKDIHLTIGLCDDDECIHNMVNQLLQIYAKNNHLIFELIHYFTGEELIKNQRELDCLLLDIEMSGMNGFETAYELQRREWNYKIVILTAKKERYREAFKIQAFRFVTKPIQEEEFFEMLYDLQQHMIGRTFVQVYRDGVAYDIMQKDILYIEADRSVSLIFTKHSEYRSEDSLLMWKKKLDERMFFQCHRAFLVNLGKIDKIEKRIATLVSGDKVLISRRAYTSLLQEYMVYDARRR